MKVVNVVDIVLRPIIVPVSFLYHSVTYPIDLYHEVRHETRNVREHRWREQHRYGQLSLVPDSQSDHIHIVPTAYDCVDSKEKVTVSARAGELFNQLPLEIILCIFKFAGLSFKELGQLLTVCTKWHDFLRHPDLWTSLRIREDIPLVAKGRKRHVDKSVRLKGLVRDIVRPSYETASPPNDCAEILRRPLEYAGTSLAKVDISCYNVEMMGELLELISAASKVLSNLSLSLLRGPSGIDISRSHYLSMGHLIPWRATLRALYVHELILRRSRQTDLEYFDLSYLENLQVLTRSGSAYKRHYLTGPLPVSLKYLRGDLQLGIVYPDYQRLLNLEQLDIDHIGGWCYRESRECLAQLLEKSSPIGSPGRSVVSDVGLDLMNMGTILPLIAYRCPALQVLRLHFRGPRPDGVGGPINLPDITACGEHIERLIDQCSALRRIELPFGGDATWYKAMLAAPWAVTCQARDIEVWCCSDWSTIYDRRLC